MTGVWGEPKGVFARSLVFRCAEARSTGFYICRDLVSDLGMLVSWLERTGHGNITLLDNASTYPPLLDYLARSSHRVIRLEENLGHRVPWRCGIVGEFGEEMPFVVTDPDVLPDPQVPAESFEYMQELLLRHPAFDKIGFWVAH